MRAPKKLVGCKPTQFVAKYDGKTYPSNKGFIEIAGNLFALSVKESKKDGVEYWVTVADLGKANQNQSSFTNNRSNNRGWK